MVIVIVISFQNRQSKWMDGWMGRESVWIGGATTVREGKRYGEKEVDEDYGRTKDWQKKGWSREAY